MVMTPSATECQAKKGLSDRINVVVDDVADDLFFISIARVPDAVGQKCGCNQSRWVNFFSYRTGQQISRDLMHDELVEWHVLIESIHDPVAITPGIQWFGRPLASFGVAIVIISVANHIQPMARPALAICGRTK